MAILGLGHVGIHVNDLDRTAAFYEDVVGLTVTDRDPAIGMVFFSSHPDAEHHELLLCGGRSSPADSLMLQQISFRCDSLEDILAYHRRFREHHVKIDMIVTHGNAVAIYFYDPEGNRCEVYWNTGLVARQPFLVQVDLDEPADVVMARVREAVERYGKDGFVDPAALAAQNLPVA
jgi:catechol 2,3-dioxygenase-like lactoylglutathione lyase family enzyme